MAHTTTLIDNRNNVPALLQNSSLQFDDTFAMATDTAGLVGITSTFTLMCWAKNEASSPSAADGIIHVRTSAVTNSIDLACVSGSNDDVTIAIVNSSNQVRQLKQYNDVVKGNTDTWIQYVVTWGGASGTGVNGLHLYTNGVDRSEDTVTVDLDDTGIVDAARDVRVGFTTTTGSKWIGPMYSAAVYNSILTPKEVTAIYNNGNARDFDLQSNFGDYKSAGNLIHYFRLGVGTTEAEFGEDRTDTVPDLSMVGVFGTPDSGDLTADIPL